MFEGHKGELGPGLYQAYAQVYADAAEVAERCGLDRERVRSVLESCACDFKFSRFEALAASNVDLEGFGYRPDLGEAISYVGPTAALNIFEHNHHEQLADRVDAFDYVGWGGTPLFNVLELAAAIASFMVNADLDREHLLQTGYPSSSALVDTPFLGHQLPNLYPTKMASQVTRLGGGSDRRDLLYVWEPRRHRPSPWAPAVPVEKMGIRRDHPVAYEDAVLLDGLTSDSAARLEHGRADIHLLKKRLLECCLQALRSGSSESLWRSCVRVLSEMVSPEEARFYLDLERRCFRCDTDSRPKFFSDGRPFAKLMSGGLAGILSIVGHCEAELTVGAYSKTRDALSDYAKVDRYGGVRFSLAPYFLWAETKNQAKLDSALDGFLDLYRRQEAFWSEYNARVNAALSDGFQEEIIVRAKVNERHAADFESTLVGFAEYSRARLQAGLRVALPSAEERRAVTSPEGYLFRRQGEYWTVVFDKKPVTLKDCKGIRYLHFLLHNPEKSFPVLSLVEHVEAASGPFGAASYQELDIVELDDSGMGISDLGLDQEVLDYDARRQYRAVLANLSAEIEQARSKGLVEKAQHLEAQRVVIEKQLQAASGLWGKPRKFSQPAELARSNVTKQITKSIKRISKDHPSLGQHFRNSVQTGHKIGYHPEQPIPWQF